MNVTSENILGAKWSSGVLASEFPRAFLGIQAAVTYVISGVMSAEEQLPRIIGQGDALRGDLEVNDCSDRQGLLLE